MSREEIAQRLLRLRVRVEAQAGAPLSNLQVPLSLALFEVMNVLGLPTAIQVYVLGVENALRMKEEYDIDWEEA